MPLNTPEIMNVLATLTENENMYVTMKGSAKGGVITGFSAVFGGLLLGPVGLAIGGTIGGITSYVITKDKFKSVPQVITEDLTTRQKEELARSVQAVISDLRVEDAVTLASLLLADKTLSITVLQLVTNFLRDQMSMEVTAQNVLR